MPINKYLNKERREGLERKRPDKIIKQENDVVFSYTHHPGVVVPKPITNPHNHRTFYDAKEPTKVKRIQGILNFAKSANEASNLFPNLPYHKRNLPK